MHLLQFYFSFVIFYTTFTTINSRKIELKVPYNFRDANSDFHISDSARTKLDQFLQHARTQQSSSNIYQRGQLKPSMIEQLKEQVTESIFSSMPPSFAMFGNHFLAMITNQSSATIEQDQNTPDQFPDLQLTTLEMLKSHGYPAEKHTVTTEDGYILEVHRIPRDGAPVVFLQHGFICSSELFVLLGPKEALAYILWDAGFDVWMGNARGNVYSRRHENLDPEAEAFWDFSWHEMGLYDLPAVLTYVLQESNQPDLFYVGHSMGTTMMLALTSLRPEFNDKLKQVHALSPVTFLEENGKPFIFLFKEQHLQIIKILEDLNVTEIFSKNSLTFRNLARSCSLSPLNNFICNYFVSNLLGGDHQSKDAGSNVARYFSSSASGTSLKTLEHIVQLFNTGKFSQFDYGTDKNLELYGDETPPEYPLQKVTAPIKLYLCTEDAFSRRDDVEMLNSKLPNSQGIIEIEGLNHADAFYRPIVGRERIFDQIVKALAADKDK